MTGSIKRKTLIFLGLVMLITMIVAASLPQLEFQRGMSLLKSQDSQAVVVAQAKADQVLAVSINKFGVMMVSLFFTVVALYLIYKLLKGTTRKSVSESFHFMLVAIAVISGFALLITLLPGSSNPIPIDTPPLTPEPVVTAPVGSVPPSFLWLVGIGLLMTSVLVGVWILTSFRRASPIDLVSWEAEKAWQALQNGLDLRDVIIKCYRQMSLALKKGKGIERKDSMTTREFEKLLETAGVPYEPIHQLTRLFDAVRYGNWQPNLADKQQAIQCLEAIMVYSRRTRGTK